MNGEERQSSVAIRVTLFVGEETRAVHTKGMCFGIRIISSGSVGEYCGVLRNVHGASRVSLITPTTLACSDMNAVHRLMQHDLPGSNCSPGAIALLARDFPSCDQASVTHLWDEIKYFPRTASR